MPDLTIIVFPLFDFRNELVLREQEDKISKEHGNHNQRLVPNDDVVDGDGSQHGYGRYVHDTVAD